MNYYIQDYSIERRTMWTPSGFQRVMRPLHVWTNVITLEIRYNLYPFSENMLIDDSEI